ncbi:MAG: DUF4157 domain-containing protein [Acidobacteriota bacterium]
MPGLPDAHDGWPSQGRGPSLAGEASSSPSLSLDFSQVSASGRRRPGEPKPISQFRESRTSAGLLSRGFIQPKLAVAAEHDVHEEMADKAAEWAVRRSSESPTAAPLRPGRLGLSTLPTARAARSVPELPVDDGRPLTASTREFAEPAFGQDFSRVRLHTSSTARLVAEGLGARAFTHGHDIWMGPGESESDRLLIAHELAHVVQQKPGVIYRRAATWLERRAWLSFFSDPVPRMLLNNYMNDTGTAVTLSQAEMVGCNPIVDLKRSAVFLQHVANLRSGGGGTQLITFSGWGGALTNGTLGNFTINYRGRLTVSPAGGWNFVGTMDFYDYWDFDTKPFSSGSGRPVSAEIKVRTAAAFLPGRPFPVTSVQVPVWQTNANTRATWSGATPSAASGPATRTAVDIEAGAAGGEAVGGPPGEVGGGEIGAQSSEDLNR